MILVMEINNKQTKKESNERLIRHKGDIFRVWLPS